MDEEDRELLREHSRLIKELQEDFQKFYKVIKHILPEIEHTKTLTRLEKEMSDSRKRIKIDIVWNYHAGAETGSAATSANSTTYAQGMMGAVGITRRTACQTSCAMDLWRRKHMEKKYRRRIGIKLLHNDEAEGSIRIAPGFTDNDIIFQLDVLQEWLADLTVLYNSKMDEFKEYAESLNKNNERNWSTDTESNPAVGWL